MRLTSIATAILLVLVAMLTLTIVPASACHPDPGPTEIGDPSHGPYVELVLASGCPHETFVCAGLDGDIHCTPSIGVPL